MAGEVSLMKLAVNVQPAIASINKMASDTATAAGKMKKDLEGGGNKALKDTSKAAKDAEKATHGLAAKFRVLSEAFRDAGGAGKSLNGSLREGSSLLEVGGIYTAAIGVAALALAGLGAAAVSAADKQEQFRNKIQSLTHSHKQTADVMGAVNRAASKSPFSLSQLENSSVILKKFGASVADTLPIVQRLAAATGTSLPNAAQVMGLVLQHNTRSLSILNRTYGISLGKLQSLGFEVSKTGQITAGTAEAWNNLNNYLKHVDAGAVKGQLNTLDGSLKAFWNTVDKVMVQIGEAIMDAFGKKGVNVIQMFTNFLNSHLKQIREWASVFVQIIKDLFTLLKPNIMAIIDLFKVLYTSISTPIKMVWDAVHGNFSAAFKAYKAGEKNTLTDAEQFGENILTPLLRAGTMAGNLYGTYYKAGQEYDEEQGTGADKQDINQVTLPSGKPPKHAKPHTIHNKIIEEHKKLAARELHLKKEELKKEELMKKKELREEMKEEKKYETEEKKAVEKVWKERIAKITQYIHKLKQEHSKITHEIGKQNSELRKQEGILKRLEQHHKKSAAGSPLMSLAQMAASVNSMFTMGLGHKTKGQQILDAQNKINQIHQTISGLTTENTGIGKKESAAEKKKKEEQKALHAVQNFNVTIDTKKIMSDSELKKDILAVVKKALRETGKHAHYQPSAETGY